MVQRHEEQRPRLQDEDEEAVEIVRDPLFRFGAGYGDLEEEREEARKPEKRKPPH